MTYIRWLLLLMVITLTGWRGGASATVTDYPVDTDAHDNEVDSTYVGPYSALSFQQCYPAGAGTNAFEPTRYHDGSPDPAGHNLVRSVLVAIPADVGGDQVNSVQFGFWAWGVGTDFANVDGLSLNVDVHDWSNGCGASHFTVNTTPYIGTAIGSIALASIDRTNAFYPSSAVENTLSITDTSGLHFDGTLNYLRLTMSCVAGDSGGQCMSAATGNNVVFLLPHEYGSHPMFLRVDHSAPSTATPTGTVTLTASITPTATVTPTVTETPTPAATATPIPCLSLPTCAAAATPPNAAVVCATPG